MNQRYKGEFKHFNNCRNFTAMAVIAQSHQNDHQTVVGEFHQPCKEKTHHGDSISSISLLDHFPAKNVCCNVVVVVCDVDKEDNIAAKFEHAQ